MKRHAYVIVVAALVTLSVASRAEACVCADDGPVRKQLEEAEIIVVGRVTGLAIETRLVDDETVEYMVATLRVSRRWKGPETATVKVSTCGDQVLICTCGVHFELGGTYLIVASNEWPQATSCGLTREYVEDDPFLDEVNATVKE
ncbi:MAG: hypothetical protein M3O61_16270 [Gemmatimonadota bacterium]|nr:hypothetical protein [Gemmatimonadota bacterium]